jgi:uncharacterized protein
VQAAKPPQYSSETAVRSALERVARFSLRRAAAVVAATGALALIGLLLALRLDPSASLSTLVDSEKSSSKATAKLHEKFGDEPIVVLVRGRLTGLLLTQDVARLLGLEGCISGNAPPRAKLPAPVCREFARRKPIQVVYGPGTFVNEAASRILDQLGIREGEQAAEAERAARIARREARRGGLGPAAQKRAADIARQQANVRFSQQALALALRTGLNSVPALNNPDFVLQLVFAPSLGAEIPKPRFSYVFPNKDAAVIEARLRPGLSHSEREEAIALVREAVKSPAFKLKFGRYMVSGPPVLSEGIASTLSGTLVLLTVSAAILIAFALAAVFRSRRRLLPLAAALATGAIALGGLSVTGGSLTIASVAALPVLMGLAAGLAIQFQVRLEERGADPPRVARIEGPVIATGGLAAVAGLLAVLFSPVPMVRTFGALLVLGLVLAFGLALTAGIAILDRGLPLRMPRVRRPSPSTRVASWLRGVSRVGRRAGLVLSGWGRGALDQALTRPRRVLWIGVAVALLGALAGTQTDVTSDLTRLGSQDQGEVKDFKTLRRETGSSGNLSVLVEADDLANPRVIAWMSGYQRRVLQRHGYRDGRPCREAQLCPALSLTSLFGNRPPRTPTQARAFFDSLPRSFARNVVSPDRRTGNISFGVRAMPVDEQKDLIDDMRSQLDPPAGVHAELGGLPVLAAESNSDLEESRWILGLLAVLAVSLMLFAIDRRAARAVVLIAPIALGWSWLVVFLLQISVNPLSAALGALIVAISASFGVLVASPFRRERAAGLAPRAALESAYAGVKRGLLASGATVVAGFAALIASDTRMLRDFGFVAVVDLVIVLAGLVVVLPAALLLAEEGLRLPRTRGEAIAAARSIFVRARLALAAAGRAIRAAPGLLRRAAPAARRRLRASVPFRK